VLCSSAEPRALARVASYVERVADPSIDVSALAFGDGTAAEASLEAIARAGGGSWGSVGSGSEARRALTEQLTGAPQTIAHDAQAQVAFNPDVVGRWRFVGLSDAGAAPWRPGAGEIGADTALAAVYEVELQPAAPRDAPLATLALSYRPAGAAGFTRTERELRIADLAPTWDGAPASLKLAALAARFADVLSGDAPVAAREALFREAQRQLPAFGGRSDVAGLVTLAGLAVHARTAAGNDDGVVAVAMGTASAPVLVERVDPVYPEAARRARFEGTVMLQALVGMDGRIEEVTVLRSVPPLDAAAVSAVRRWRYKPSMAGGQPVPAHVTVSVRFSM
jgi:TonB family protein